MKEETKESQETPQEIPKKGCKCAPVLPIKEKVVEQVTVYCGQKEEFDKQCYQFYEKGYQPAFESFRHDINTGYAFVMILYKMS